MTNDTNQPAADFPRLLDNYAMGDTTVTVVQDTDGIWTLVATADGHDLMISPTGRAYQDLDLDSRFACGPVGTILEFIIENV